MSMTTLRASQQLNDIIFIRLPVYKIISIDSYMCISSEFSSWKIILSKACYMQQDVKKVLVEFVTQMHTF